MPSFLSHNVERVFLTCSVNSLYLSIITENMNVYLFIYYKLDANCFFSSIFGEKSRIIVMIIIKVTTIH